MKEEIGDEKEEETREHKRLKRLEEGRLKQLTELCSRMVNAFRAAGVGESEATTCAS